MGQEDERDTSFPAVIDTAKEVCFWQCCAARMWLQALQTAEEAQPQGHWTGVRSMTLSRACSTKSCEFADIDQNRAVLLCQCTIVERYQQNPVHHVRPGLALLHASSRARRSRPAMHSHGSVEI
jgi:hypothetical protein